MPLFLRRALPFVLALALLLSHLLFSPLGRAAAATASAGDWQQALGTWRSERFERLTAPDGWLTLVGLFWLQEGSNRLGASPGNEMKLPAGPLFVGTVELSGGTTRTATFVAAPGVEVRVRGGGKVTRVPLAADTSGKPTVLEHGTLSWFLLERGGRLALRVKDRDATTRKEFTGLDYFPAGPDWRIAAPLEPAAAGETIMVPNVLGNLEATPTAGKLVFTIGERELRLATILEPGSDSLFVVFGDATNGKETYGGGRFLDVDKPGADGRTTIDFNRAYNPPCAFTPFATCPLPPKGNRLEVRVEAGEKKYGKGHS